MLIPAQNMEIEKIYLQIFGGNYRAVAICSANEGEGVTSIALALAQRNLISGQSTLIVDFNLYRPSMSNLLTADKPSLLEDHETETETLDQPQLVTVQKQSIALLGITCPVRRDLIIKLRKPGVLEKYIVEWKKTFDTIIFDTSPINRVNASNIPAERVAAACDGYVLVVLAGNTTEAMVSSSVEKLKVVGSNILGCVFNDRDNPTLKNELLRKIHHFEPRFGNLAQYASNWLRKNRLLSFEI